MSSIRELVSKRPGEGDVEDTKLLTENPNKIKIPEPEFDLEYLCDPQKRDEIRQNILYRKGVGDIDKVVSYS